jgi:hypothetical protein
MLAVLEIQVTEETKCRVVSTFYYLYFSQVLHMNNKFIQMFQPMRASGLINETTRATKMVNNAQS